MTGRRLRFVAACSLAAALICGISPAACAEEPGVTATSDPAQVRALPTDITRWRGRLRRHAEAPPDPRASAL